MKRFKYHERSLSRDLGRMALKVICAKEGVYMTNASTNKRILKEAQFQFFTSSTKKMSMTALRRAVTPGITAAFQNFRTKQEK